MDQTLIEQIVANVLAQLQPAVTLRAETVAAPAATEVTLDEAVITAAILGERLQPGQSVRIGARSILTPSGRDWLREHQVRWQRAGNNAPAVAATRRWLLIGTVTPAVRNLRETLTGWTQELLGRPAELAETAVRAIASGDAELVVAVSEAADVVACRANRNQRVRAAVVASAAQVRLLTEQLSPNVLVVNPRGRSFVDLRNVLQAVAALPAPTVPQGWE